MTHLQKIFVIIIGFVLFATGCMTSQKMDGWIADNQIVASKLKTSDYILVKAPDIKKSDTISLTKKGKFKLIPAIVYWRTENSFVSTLNQWVPLGTFNSSLIQYANAKGLKQKLNGQKIEFSVDKFPATFSLTFVSHLIYFGLYYVQWSKDFVNPVKQNLSISYRLLKDNLETKKGTITVTDPSKAEYLKFFQTSYKKLTMRYLEQYDNNIQAISKELVDKLILEL